MDTIRYYDSPIGKITIAAADGAVIGLWFEGQAHYGAAISSSRAEGNDPACEDAVRWLDCYFAGEIPDFTPAVRMRGTAFQKDVWQLLMSVPYGGTESYGQIAERLRQTRGSASARAVGSAAGRNPVSLIIPCHRILGAGGALTGYAGGLERKKWLLEFERQVSSRVRRS